MYQISLMLICLSLIAAWLALLFAAALWIFNLVGAPAFIAGSAIIIGILLTLALVREIRMNRREAKP